MLDAAVTAVRVADVVEKPHQRRKTERRKAYGKFNRLYVLCIRAFLIIYLVGASIYQLVLWIKKWRERRKDEE